MTPPPFVRPNPGRRVFGAAAFLSGAVALAGHGSAFVDVVGAAQIAGGAVIQVRGAAKAGACVLGAAYFVAALACVPRIAGTPLVYDAWGNFFEPFSQAIGAAVVVASSSPACEVRALPVVRSLFGLCAASFALEQAFSLQNTASLVPAWIPPGPQFWAAATTAFFALAAVALVANRLALTATRLLTAMILAFGVLVWVPLLIAKPHSRANWSELAETFAIAGAAWILADLLAANRGSPAPSRNL